ncbi:Ig-like domain-containing protein [Actinospica robiniae]|uniref:Ig-like domain-containing protein n=1 Tax=Actinospica robiniae TaxID=304901 RepID=UPI0003FA42BB|nr:Ig-like domain-containing protein [Actinospica robiniae]
MSRMFHRAVAVSVIGTAALVAPVAAMAADTGGGTTGETATSVVVHLPQSAQPGEPFTVTARITPRDGVATPGSPQDPDFPGDSAGAPDSTPEQPGATPETRSGTGADGSQTGTVKGKGKSKGTGHRKGTGRRKGKGKTRRPALTGEVTFIVDGKAQPPVEVTRDQASEQISVPLGRHTISAEYSGDDHFEGADSPTVAFALTDGSEQGDGSQQ